MNQNSCINCGHENGFRFGICPKCTPKEYIILQEKLDALLRKNVLKSHEFSKLILEHLLENDIEYTKTLFTMRKLEDKHTRGNKID